MSKKKITSIKFIDTNEQKEKFLEGSIDAFYGPIKDNNGKLNELGVMCCSICLESIL